MMPHALPWGESCPGGEHQLADSQVQDQTSLPMTGATGLDRAVVNSLDMRMDAG